jgi:TolA-binding protein
MSFVMGSLEIPAQDTNAPVAQPIDQAAPPATPSPPGGIIVTTPAAARFDTAMSFFNAGQYVDAVTAFSDFVRDFPQDRRREEALYRLAESYRSLGRTDDALAA